MLRLLILLAFAAPLSACLWDYDTLAQESKGMPDVKAAIVGGFPRNPPTYYEMRLERVTNLLAENPDDLDAYDAAGVACDRLGRSDEAIEWMARKLAAMDRIGYDASQHAQPNHRYRYLANLGTFHAHRWFKNGAKRGDMADMLRGRDLIAQAIKENPDAHFGREKYQLMAMDWVISIDKLDDEQRQDPNRTFVSRSESPLNIDFDQVGKADEVLAGCVGLITMGAAWESVDVVSAMRLVLTLSGRAQFSYFAKLRVLELIADGKRSVLWPDGWSPEDPKAAFVVIGVTSKTEVEQEYADLRAQADAWHKQRTDYMLARMQGGEHPDTHTEFWAGFAGNPDRMEILELGGLGFAFDEAKAVWRRGGIASYVLTSFLAAVVSIGLILTFMRRRRRAKAAALMAQSS